VDLKPSGCKTLILIILKTQIIINIVRDKKYKQVYTLPTKIKGSATVQLPNQVKTKNTWIKKDKFSFNKNNLCGVLEGNSGIR
jgi:hypothetical protein